MNKIISAPAAITSRTAVAHSGSVPATAADSMAGTRRPYCAARAAFIRSRARPPSPAPGPVSSPRYTRLATGNSPGPKPSARPAAASASRTTDTCAANAAVGDDPAPKNPSHSRTPRRTADSADPPNHSLGPGFWNGLGSIDASLSWKNSPSKVTDGSVHSAFISARPSVNRARYRSGLSPNAANGRCGPPDPTPTSTRPADNWSSEASAFARCTGECRVVTKTVQPSRSVLVQAAA